jgi:putative membrane protein
MEYTLMSLKKLIYMVPLVIALGMTGNAIAQTSPPKADEKAPVAGANSFTEGQAQSRIEGAGFTQVTGLKKDDQGVWRGSATKNGKQVPVSVDFRGNVVSP